MDFDGTAILEAEALGKQAFIEGKPKTINPYDARTERPLATAWFVGHDRAAFHARRKDRVEHGRSWPPEELAQQK